jgi:predicted  nucleic acid-binding Zn-ribbon protein
MPANELQILLQKLKLEINNIKVVDKSSVEMLDKMKMEIEKALEHREAKQGIEKSSLLEGLEKSVEHFEASHPELTAKINNVIYFLNNVGL